MRIDYLVISMEQQISWFHERADHLARGHEQTFHIREGVRTDVSKELVDFYRHRAANLGCLVTCYPLHTSRRREWDLT